MFKKLFKRSRAAPVTLAPAPAPAPQAPIAVAPKELLLEDFRQGWQDKWEISHEVVESNGGDTGWGLWTEAKKVEENSFAETVLEEDEVFDPTAPMPLEPKY